jgi:uncharacterized protein YchJ
VKNMKAHTVRFAALGAALLLSACSTVKPRQDDAALEKLPIERWNLLIAHQAEKAYDYLSPGTRLTESREKYAQEMNNRPVHWEKVDYIDRKCDDPDACTVQLRAAYSVNMSARLGHDVHSVTLLWERWIRLDGHWYYLENRPTSPVRKAGALKQ